MPRKRTETKREFRHSGVSPGRGRGRKVGEQEGGRGALMVEGGRPFVRGRSLFLCGTNEKEKTSERESRSSLRVSSFYALLTSTPPN